MKLAPDSPLAARLSQVMYVVRASAFEELCLWKQYCDRLDWVTDLYGQTMPIGMLDGRAVMLSLRWAKLNGQTVLFFDCSGDVADYALANAWLDANCAPRAEHDVARVAAFNFLYCAQAVAKASGVALRGAANLAAPAEPAQLPSLHADSSAPLAIAA
jgi:hypothetical protein